MKISVNKKLLRFGNIDNKLRRKKIGNLKKDKFTKKVNILKVQIENKNKIDSSKLLDFEKNLEDNGIAKKNEVRKETRSGDNRKRRKNIVYTKTKLPKSYFALLVSMFLLASFSVKLVYETYKDNLEEDYAVFSNNGSYEDNLENTNISNDTLLLQDERTNNKDTIEEFINEKKKETLSSSKQETYIAKVEPLVFAKPIEGEIQKLYSPDKVIYSKTLEMWKTHDGIDISASNLDVVKSIEKGTVERIYEDAFFGMTIIIDHSQGYKSIYSNLDSNVLVKEKQTIAKGTRIGKVGKTSVGEYCDNSHLHFALKYNNELIDPTYIFK